MQCTVAVYDTEEIWWRDLNVEICREYLNSYPAPALGRAKKLTGVMWQKKKWYTASHTLKLTPYKRKTKKKETERENVKKKMVKF